MVRTGDVEEGLAGRRLGHVRDLRLGHDDLEVTQVTATLVTGRGI